MAVNGFAGLPRSQQRVDMLMADFSGLDHLEDIVNKVLDRLRGSAKWPSGMSRETFDATFAEVVRKELGKTLGIIRANAIKKANAVVHSSVKS